MNRCHVMVSGRDCRNPVTWAGGFSRKKPGTRYFYCTRHKNAHERWPNGVAVWTPLDSTAQRDSKL